MRPDVPIKLLRSAYRAGQPNAQRGFSLIEMMVSATLGLLLLAGIGTLFVSTSRSYRENELIAGMQDQARFALSTLARDLAMAGYWGGLLGTANVVPNLGDAATTNDSTSATLALTPARDCGPTGTAWSFALDTPLQFHNHIDSGTPWPCIGHQRAGTDAVAIRRVSGQATGEMLLGDSQVRLRPHHFYLQTNATVGTLMRWGVAALDAPDAGDDPSSAPMSFYRYFPRIYFIRDFSLTPGDGVPTLCRKELCPTDYSAGADAELASCGEGGGGAGTPGYYSECIAEGVEDLQIVWGLDTNNDHVVDRYTAAPDLDQTRLARSAQIHLLVRSRRGNPQYTDSKTYRLADQSAFTPSTVADAAGTPPDRRTRHFYRRAYSTTVQLRNLGIQEGSGVQ